MENQAHKRASTVTDLRSDLKKFLKTDRIRLWDPPYTNRKKLGVGSYSKDFIEFYLEKLATMHPDTPLDVQIVERLLESVRIAAVQKRQKQDAEVAAEGAAAANPKIKESEEQNNSSESSIRESTGRGIRGARKNNRAGTLKKGYDLLKSFKKGKKEQVSFENDAFKLAEKMQEEEAAQDSEEELYFDQLSPDEQQQYEKNMIAEEKLKAEKEAAAAAKRGGSKTGSALQTLSPPSEASRRPSSNTFDLAYDSEEDEDVTESDLNSDGNTVILCWRRARDGILLEQDEGVELGGTIDMFETDALAESRGGRKPKGSISKWAMSMKRGPKSRTGIHSSTQPETSFVRAEEMRMSAEQRVAVMTMVRDNSMTVDEAVEFVIQQEAKLAIKTRRNRTASGSEDSGGKIAPLAELMDLLDTYSEKELPKDEKLQILQDVRDGKKSIKVAVRTVKAIRRRSLNETRPSRPAKPARPERPAVRPAPPARPARPAGFGSQPTRPPRPVVSTTASEDAVLLSQPLKKLDEIAGDNTIESTPTQAIDDNDGAQSDPYGSDSEIAVTANTKSSMTDAEREARYAGMMAPQDDADRAGKSKIWKALNPAPLAQWSGGDKDEPILVSDTSGELSSKREAELDIAVSDAQAALDAIQAIDNSGGGYAELSESDDDDDDDGAEEPVLEDDELLQMIEAKRHERELESERRAAELRDKHAALKAEEDARLEAERAEFERIKELEKAAKEAEKNQIAEESKERMENDLQFDFKFRNSIRDSTTDT